MWGKKERVILTVEGMSCDHCRMTVEQGLQELPGVAQVKVSLSTKQAEVTFNPKKVSLEQLKEKVQALGYQVG
ncbi:MAG: copper chaperone [Nitrospinota bacterium]|nr:MAG: copper chaperone [Nitrospinota bacterium]